MLRAQFTYTASRRPGPFDTGAGWKVSAISKVGPVSDEVIRAAARNVGGFVPPPLPELASKADVDALPHCLRLDVLDGPEPLVCLSSIVAAGPDYSGRPNTFAHGLVLSGDGLADGRGRPLRPADLWDAALWRRPLGAQAAEGTLLDEHLRDLTRGPLDDAALETFTRAHPDQRELVLAAVERYLGGAGPLVVVGDASFSSVATWLHLAGRLLLPASAWRLPFSTYERLRDARAANGWPFAVVGVPAADAAAAGALPGSRFTVLRDDEQPARASLGRWTLHDGAELTAGPWARLAESVITSEFLPVVAEQVEALAVEVEDSTLDRPLWALGAAVLLDDDLAEFFGSEAADVVAEHWPTSLPAEATFDRLLERVRELAAPGSHATERILERAGVDPHGMVAHRASIEPVRTALASPVDFEKHPLPGPLAAVSPAGLRVLDKVLGGALEKVSQAVDPARDLLEIAGLMDGTTNPVELRLRAVELARELLVPRLVDPATDPIDRGWAPVPPWLWNSLLPALAAMPGLQHGSELPGRNLSAATHEWLGSLSVPVGDLTVDELQGTGPIEWERAAYRLFIRRAEDVTPLERAAAYLSMISSNAFTEGIPIERWAGYAADETYPRGTLDLITATVLMEALPQGIPFASAFGAVLQRTSPSSTSQAAVAQFRQRDEEIPAAVQKLLEQHMCGGRSEDVLITAYKQLLPVLIPVTDRHPASAWIPVAEAMLRIDVRQLRTIKGLPDYAWRPSMPWDEGWAKLREGQTDPGARSLLAAHLLCRGARAVHWPEEDRASRWLTGEGDRRGRRWAETVAEALFISGDPEANLVATVERLVAETPRKQGAGSTAGSEAYRREDSWREDAIAWARRIVAEHPRRPSPFPRTQR
ncbi:GAP1-N2 domain-containing protein [Geodermatophilus sp. SYSU D00684]